MVLIELFWSFVKIGFTSFGGLSMIPLINAEMISHGWMTAGEVSDIIAIAEMTPGPLGPNCATFAGIKAAGIAGAVAANLGVLSPTLTHTAAAALFFDRVKQNRRMTQIMTGVRPACVGMIAGVTLSLGITNYATDNFVDLPLVAIGLLDLVLMLRWRVSVPKVIVLSAALGLLCFGIQ